MADYIEREALIKHLCNACDGWCENVECDCVNCKSEYRCDMVQEIGDCPAADVAPVVWCKDCVHWYAEEEVCLKIYSDGAVSPYAWQTRNPDDFCSYGKRREEDG